MFWFLTFFVVSLLALPLSVFGFEVSDAGKVWEVLYQAQHVEAVSDDDGDGVSNLLEARAGTDPANADCRFAVSRVTLQQNGIVVRWQAKDERVYSIEHRADAELGWDTMIAEISGQAGQQEMLIPDLLPGDGELRLKVMPQTIAEEAAMEALGDHDTDGDGISDVEEYLAGTHPFDPESRFEISEVLNGPFIEIDWSGMAGKVYQLQCSADLSPGSWIDVGGARYGRDGLMKAIFSLAEVPGRFFRVQVDDRPSEIEGVTEWEAVQLGLDPLERNEFRRYGLELDSYLSAPVVVEIETPEPVANLTREGQGLVEIRRTGGVKELVLSYSVSGSAVPGEDYEELPGEIVLPFGVKSVSIPIVPKPDGAIGHTKSVILTFQVLTDVAGVFESRTVSVNLIRERVISVRDFGAVGNGVTDDTTAIQAAIMALENSAEHNTLWFPAGQYRLSKLTSQPFTSGSYFRTLFLGATDLSQRDLVFAGEPGAVLLSKTGTARSHILLTRARWRSLYFHGLTFEKDSQPLRLVQAGSEPNGAYGVAVVDWYGQPLEKLGFRDCRFINCHGAIRTFSNGSDLWGKFKQFSMHACEVLNPYGSNTVEGAAAYGGGQQVNLTPWVSNAVYKGNLFEGGPNVVEDFTLNPDGVPKDGSHFGSPQRLRFSENLVRNMGVEAIFPTSDPRVGYVASPFQVPPANTGQTVEASIVAVRSVFTVGSSINIRAWLNNANRNCVLVIRGVDSLNNILVLENMGQSSEILDGYVLPVNAAVYAQYKQPCEALVIDNVVESFSGRAGMGIASNAKSYIAGNFIRNQNVGINFYPEVRDVLGSPERGSVVEGNLIDWIPSGEDAFFSYGVQSWGVGVNVKNNFVQSGVGLKCFGVAARGFEDWVSGNYVSTRLPMDNGYSSPTRAVGVGIGNTASGAVSSRNYSFGFDVGLGPAQPFQNIPYILNVHSSFNDVLSIDPRGVITP